MSKRTPGPWILSPCERGQKWAVLAEQEVYPDHDRLIAFVGEDANARLIAAAPDLLAALEPFAAMLDKAMETNAHRGDATPLWRYNEREITLGHIKQASAAIAVVKGD